jgi:hypothetical protein
VGRWRIVFPPGRQESVHVLEGQVRLHGPGSAVAIGPGQGGVIPPGFAGEFEVLVPVRRPGRFGMTGFGGLPSCSARRLDGGFHPELPVDCSIEQPQSRPSRRASVDVTDRLWPDIRPTKLQCANLSSTSASMMPASHRDHG